MSVPFTNSYIDGLIHNIQDLIFVVDKEGSVVFMNSALKKFFDLQTDSDKNTKLKDLLEPSKEKFILQEVSKSLQSFKPITSVIQVKKRWFNLSINPFKEDNGLYNLAIVLAYDVTESMEKQMELNTLAEDLEVSRDAFQDNASELARAYDELEYSRQELERFSKKLEEQNKLLQESEEKQKILNAQKDKFVSIISHDLRAPFTSILGYSEALTNAWNTITESEKLEFIGIINKAAKTQLELLDTLLQWSRLETNRVQVKPEVVNMNNLVENCVLSLSGIAQKKNIKIEQSVSPKVNVLGDHLLLSQVIQNIISNSLKFTKNGGKITISYDGREGEHQEKFIIQDTGIGIPESIRTKLFRIDSKVSRKGTSGEAGTGLGLLVCKEIIDLHNGSIEVNSKENEGTAFSFTLPRAFPNVLIISDNKDNTDYLNNIISEFFIDFKTITFGNVTEAEKYFERPEFSLLIYDKNDSDFENDIFFKIMNKNELVQIVPTVLFVYNANQDILESFLSNGIDFIISKPFEENLIVDTFTKILFGLLGQS